MGQGIEGGGSLAAKPLWEQAWALSGAAQAAQEKRRQALLDAQTIEIAIRVLERRPAAWGNTIDDLKTLYKMLLDEAR